MGDLCGRVYFYRRTVGENKGLFSKTKKSKPYKNIRATVNGIYWIMKTGSTWRTLPHCFGRWQEVYRCFSRWTKEGIFENIFSELSREADTSEISADSIFVKGTLRRNFQRR